MKRIFFGFILMSIAMAYASLIQYWIYNSPPYYNHPLVDNYGHSRTGSPNQVSVWHQVPMYLFIGISESKIPDTFFPFVLFKNHSYLMFIKYHIINGMIIHITLIKKLQYSFFITISSFCICWISGIWIYSFSLFHEMYYQFIIPFTHCHC